MFGKVLELFAALRRIINVWPDSASSFHSMKNFISMSDNDLLGLIYAGDEEAFVTLYRRWQQAVYRFALQMSGSNALAENI